MTFAQTRHSERFPLTNERQIESDAPVCIAGMHRSGSSTVAQLLHRCGLYLGAEGELFAPGDDNVDGYWENRRFVELNERIFKMYEGGWDLPPYQERGWEKDERLNSLRTEAARVVSDFVGHEPWGWKDPRNSLTLPFWMSLLPEAKVVVSLRNPLEVAHSLRKRGSSSYAFGLDLWTTYYERLLQSMPRDRYIVTHYEAHFYRPRRELRRVLDFLRLPASDQLVAHASSSTLKALRHHSFTIRHLLEAKVPARLLDLYQELCLQADWHYEISDTRMPKDDA